MDYKLFTFPSCEPCADIKNYLNEKGIKYEEINIGLSSNKKNPFWLAIYMTQTLKKDEKGIILPILAKFNEDNLEKIAQNQNIKDLFD